MEIMTGMLLACSGAGVSCVDWLILDDVLRMERQCLQLHGLLSFVFVLGVGTAQGRSFSVHAFNALLQRLGAWLPPFANHVLLEVSRRMAPTSYLSCCDQSVLQPLAHRILDIANQEKEPWLAAQKLSMEVLASLPSSADRQTVMELLGVRWSRATSVCGRHHCAVPVCWRPG